MFVIPPDIYSRIWEIRCLLNELSVCVEEDDSDETIHKMAILAAEMRYLQSFDRHQDKWWLRKGIMSYESDQGTPRKT
jgi:hypothetical protein